MLQTIVALQMFANSVKDRLESEDGATVVEYGIVLLFAIVVLGAVLVTAGQQITAWFQGITGGLGNIFGTTPTTPA